MKRLILLSIGVVTMTSLFAQKAKTFAITSQSANDYYWSNIKEIDVTTGKVIKTVFESDKSPYQIVDAVSKNLISTSEKNFTINGLEKPFAYGVAAVALDARHNRLYYSPMHTAQIRYIDLSNGEAKFFYLPNKLMDNSNGFLTEENHLTRMVLIGKVGYAITNNGNHLYQFTTGKKPEVTDMGGLIDDPSNGAISVHNKCTSWGGDIIASEDGILYLVSANKHVFSIDVASRIAKHLGSINGVPAQFTTNGAVVNDEGAVVLTSSNPNAGFYELDIKTLQAKAIPNSVANVSISDLASANLLPAQNATDNKNDQKIEKQIIANDKVSVYPNPITTSQFKLNFEEMTNGTYAVIVTDLMGRQVFNKRIVIQNESQVETINMERKPSNGLYLVKVTDASGKAIFVNKLIVQ